MTATKIVLLDPGIHRKLNILRAAKDKKSFNEIIGFLYTFYYKKEIEGTELDKIAIITEKEK
ncbi:MAG: hypothetical protein ACTSQE_15735 [Candidatus Heimdallarchaeaceae archaeon]